MKGWIPMMCLVLLTGVVQAMETDTFGETWPVAERDLLSVIEERIATLQKNGEWHRMQAGWQKKARQMADRPAPVTGMARTGEARTHYFDPAITLSSDIRNEQGSVIIASGTTVNPLHYSHPDSSLLFYDGDDPDQVKWMQKILAEDSHAKPVLVRGSVSAQTKLLGRTVWFDQAGSLTTRLGIHQIPAMAYAEGDRIRIDEVMP